MRKLPQLAIVLALILAAGRVHAEVRLPRIFTDHMVLQQELPIAVWGWAAAGEKVTISLGGKTVTAVADPDGKWLAKLPAMKADGKPHTLSVKAGNTIKLEDVLLGEVWICSGQSNMARETNVEDHDPNIRLFWIEGSTVPREHDLCEKVIGWTPAVPEAVEAVRQRRREEFCNTRVGGFTEVGYVFGKQIHAELNVPVGLIKTAFGGSQAHAWTPLPGIEEEFPFDKDLPKERGYKGHIPGLLYQSMVHGMVPMTVRGVVWYQGENDGRGWDYDEKLAAMIESWRQRFERPELPLLQAQIAQTTYASGMERIWECQAKLAATMPNVYLGASNDLWDNAGENPDAIRIDEGNDRTAGTGWPIAGTSNPHPPNKHIVANRLAEIALAETYGLDLGHEVFAPVYDSHRIESDKILVKFKHVGDGLKTDDGEAPNWFEVSDGTKQQDRDIAPLVYHKAEAKIVGKDTVEVSSASVKSPKHVRLAWHPLARHNLYNSSDVPAINFRTDTQPSKKR